MSQKKDIELNELKSEIKVKRIYSKKHSVEQEEIERDEEKDVKQEFRS